MIPLSLHASGTVFPWLTSTSICRSFPTICSGVNVFFGIFPFLSVSQSLVSTGTKKPGQVITITIKMHQKDDAIAHLAK